MSRPEPKSASALRLATGGTLIKAGIDGDDAYLDRTWYRGRDAGFYPEKNHLLDERSAIRHIIGSSLPNGFLIDGSTKVTAFGSCFAVHISDWLASTDYKILTARDGPSNDAYIVKFGDGMVNTFVIREQFEWAFENRVRHGGPWFGPGTTAFEPSEDIRQVTRSTFMKTDLFILTLGLSEIWYDSISGRVFWRAVPEREFQSDRHRFRTSTVRENVENLHAIYQLIRKHRPDAKIIFTLSPVPLAATFREMSCITANQVSKAILRAALDEFLSDIGDQAMAFYWPSYEIAQTFPGDIWTEELRHIKREVLDYIMTLFETVCCVGTTPRMTLCEAWIRARSASGSLPENTSFLVENIVPEQFDLMPDRLKSKLPNPSDWEMILRRLLERHGDNPSARSWLETRLQEITTGTETPMTETPNGR